jgi:hypothetical protein
VNPTQRDPAIVIPAFIRQVRVRLTRQRALVILAWTAVGVAAAMLALAIVSWTTGATPGLWRYAAVVAAGGLLAGLIVWLRRPSAAAAAVFADRHFRFRDALVAARHFLTRQPQDGWRTLQLQWAARATAHADVADIRAAVPWRLWTAAGALLAVAITLELAPPSAAAQQRAAERMATQERTSALNLALEKAVEELLETADETEAALLEPNALRQLVAQLQEQGDVAEAMRQYARLEQQLVQQLERLDRRADAKLLAKVGTELQEDPVNAELGQRLRQGKLQAAAAELEQLKLQPADAAANARAARQRLEQAAQRMGDAVRRQASAARTPANRAATDSVDATDSNDARHAEKLDPHRRPADSEDLREQIRELERLVKPCDGRSSDCRQGRCQSGSCQQKSGAQRQAAQQQTNRQLDQMARSWRHLAAARRMQQRLGQLRQQLSQCQSYLAGASERPFQSTGQQAGVGADQRENLTQDPNHGQPTLLRGIEGTGPSESTIETAATGDGVSGRTARPQDRDFTRQLESFVAREDIPPRVKSGVKRYFEGIHGNEEAE